MNDVITHLWQSTAFLGLIWLLTAALRNYPARIRCSFWIAASLKFLVPFALLSAFGSHWALPDSPALVHGTIYKVVQEMNQPFAGAPLRGPGAVPPVHSRLH